jgi:hypothetical protein
MPAQHRPPAMKFQRPIEKGGNLVVDLGAQPADWAFREPVGDATRGPLGNIFGALIKRVRFAADSPLEENGFEPSVPRSMESTSGAKSGLQEGQPAPKRMSGGISRKQSDQACSAIRA